MQKPAYKIKIGSEIFDSSMNQDIISINVDLDIDIPSDSFNIVLQPCSKANNIKNGDAAIIEIGYENALNKIITGSVENIYPKISDITIIGLSVVSILTKQKINQVYEKQTAGAIIKDLAGKVGINVKDVDDGLSFPMYVIDDTKGVYAHMRELARKCGFDLFLTGDGRLIFKKYVKQTPKPFKYGRDILEAEIDEPLPIAACVKVYGESPSSFKGIATSHWMTKKVVEGVAGSGNTTFLIEDPVIKDKDTADKVATSLLEILMTPFSGTLKSLGNSRVGLGDTIEIKEMPDKRMNGEFKVTNVSHVFNKDEGFISTIGWVKKISISPAVPPLAVAPPIPKPPSPLEDKLNTTKSELEDSRLKLLDSVETSEMTLENLMIEINSAIAQLDKLAKEMLEAAEEVRKKALESSKEIYAKADELKKETDTQKKKIEESQADALANLDKHKKDAYVQIEKNEQEIEKLNKSKEKESEEKAKEIDNKIKENQKKIDDSKKVIEDTEKKVKTDIEPSKKKLEEMSKKSKEQIDEAKKTADKMVKEADEKFAATKKKVENTKKEAGKMMESVKKAYNESRNKVIEGKKMVEAG